MQEVRKSIFFLIGLLYSFIEHIGTYIFCKYYIPICYYLWENWLQSWDFSYKKTLHTKVFFRSPVKLEKFNLSHSCKRPFIFNYRVCTNKILTAPSPRSHSTLDHPQRGPPIQILHPESTVIFNVVDSIFIVRYSK